MRHRPEPLDVRERWPYFRAIVGGEELWFRAPGLPSATRRLLSWLAEAATDAQQAAQAAKVAAEAVATGDVEEGALEAVEAATQRAADAMDAYEGAAGWLLLSVWAHPRLALEAADLPGGVTKPSPAQRAEMGRACIEELCDHYGLSWAGIQRLVGAVGKAIQQNNRVDEAEYADVVFFGTSPEASTTSP